MYLTYQECMDKYLCNNWVIFIIVLTLYKVQGLFFNKTIDLIMVNHWLDSYIGLEIGINTDMNMDIKHETSLLLWPNLVAA